MLRAATASAVGMAGVSVTATTATAATRPTLVSLDFGDGLSPTISSDGIGEAVRVDTDASASRVFVNGGLRYPRRRQTQIAFDGFDSTPDEVDVALIDMTRGDLINATLFQTVSFVAEFEYDSQSDVDDFFVDIVGDTVVDDSI